jgi:subtilisin family serine protease
MLPILMSCGARQAQVYTAPTSRSELGIIGKCATVDQAQALAASHDIRYRVINEKKKIIEFYDIDSSELIKHIPTVRVKQNQLYENLVQSNNQTIQNVSNQQYYGAHSPSYREEDGYLSYFEHLDQINGREFTNNIKGQGVTIAVVDTGVYYNHPHLSPNIKTNDADSHTSSGADQFDNDNNGYTDDYVGWDFYNYDAFPIDDNGHGTHVAGLAAGTLGGVAPEAKIMPVKVLSSQGSGDLATITAGILYAIQNGADIINLSLGGPGSGSLTRDLQDLINVVEIAKQNNVLIIAAAGNGGNDGLGDCNDENPVYPSNIPKDNMISVAAVDSNNSLTSYSNYGTNTVHIAAPGGDYSNGGLLSTGIPNCNGPCNDNSTSYFRSSGTSMATPVVAGLAALIKSSNTNMNYKDVKNKIMASGMVVPQLDQMVISGKVIDVKAALSL